MTATAVDITEVVKKKIKELPPLPLVVHKLIATLDDDKSSADDVMKVLSSDQALASKVLKLVNSSFYGLSGEVSTPSRAVVILGFAAVRNLALGLSVAKFMAGAGRGDKLQKFWDHSITTAAACQLLARRTNYRDPEEAFIAGLLHDIGHLVLSVALPREYEEAFGASGDDTLALEQQTLGITHARAGQMLLKHWKLPKALTDAVRFHHKSEIFCGSKDPLVSLVALGDTFAGVHGEVFERSITSTEFLDLVKVTGLDLEETGDILRDMETRIAETRLFLKIATDEEMGPPPVPGEPPAAVVMICTDPAKATWTRQVLDYFGVKILPMKEFFAGGREDEVDLVILDPLSISAEQKAKLKPFLDQCGVPMAVFGVGEGEADMTDAPCAYLPLAFSRADLWR